MKRICSLLVFCLLITACTPADLPDGLSAENNQIASSSQVVLPSNTPKPTNTPLPTPTATFTTRPTSTLRPTNTPSPSPTIPLCTNQAEFVRHLSVSEYTKLEPGVFFAKVWRIRNIGTCTWTTDYSFVFTGGERFNAPETTPLTHDVPPGETIDLQIVLVTPLEPDLYSGSWMLQDPTGNQFGFENSGAQPFAVVVNVIPITVNERLETLSCG